MISAVSSILVKEKEYFRFRCCTWFGGLGVSCNLSMA